MVGACCVTGSFAVVPVPASVENYGGFFRIHYMSVWSFLFRCLFLSVTRGHVCRCGMRDIRMSNGFLNGLCVCLML